jgi:RNA recognition motif-containing protein
VREKHTRKCKGYAFIETPGFNDAKQIIKALNGTMLGERALTISIVAEPEVITKADIKPTSRENFALAERFTRQIVVADGTSTKTKRPRIKS